MSTSGGFWPGESPAEQEDVHEPETPVADPPGWPTPRPEEEPVAAQPGAEVEVKPATEQTSIAEPHSAEPQPAEPEPAAEEAEAEPDVARAAHVPGEVDIPDGVAVLEGSPSGADRTVGVVVSRFNGEISNRLLSSALEALAAAGVADERITVMPVPGAFELPIGAMALAKTRRYSCVIALGCVVRGETAHFDYVAGEAASGLQLAGLETGVPVAFGVLTVDTSDQAEARVDKGADAARAALEMADLFSQVRASAR
ncbi:MAG: 6,7-dimethyl-8-ribityllumazine synthase [Gaiellaceae bacterium]